MQIDSQELIILLEQLDMEVKSSGLCGYDPRLFWYLPAAKLYHKKKNRLTNFLRKMEVATYRAMPFLIKPYLKISNINQSISPYGLGLAIQAYVNYYRIFKEEKYLASAIEIETVLKGFLITTTSKNIGVPTPPEDDSVFSLPAGAEVALSYIDLFELTQKDYYLSQAIKIANSFIFDHKIKYLTGDRIAIDYYSNNDGLHVLNANALAAVVFHRLNVINNTLPYQNYIDGIVNYILPYLDYEKLPYSGVEDRNNKNVIWNSYDLYHTGFVLCALLKIAKHNNNKQLIELLYKQYQFLINNFIVGEKIIVLPHRNVVDIHGLAEFIKVFSEYDGQSEYIFKLIYKNIMYMKKNNTFYYQRGKTKIFMYMPRWGHFPMMLSISHLLATLQSHSNN